MHSRLAEFLLFCSFNSALESSTLDILQRCFGRLRLSFLPRLVSSLSFDRVLRLMSMPVVRKKSPLPPPPLPPAVASGRWFAIVVCAVD